MTGNVGITSEVSVPWTQITTFPLIGKDRKQFHNGYPPTFISYAYFISM